VRTILMISLASTVALAAASRPVQAQSRGDREDRPYRGIFRGGVEDAGDLLTANLSLGGGYSNDQLSRPVGDLAAGPPPTFTGPFSRASGNLQYSFVRDRGSFNASAGASARYYRARQDVLPGYTAAVGGSVALTQRINWEADVRGVDQPLYGLTLFPDAVGVNPGVLSPIDYTQDVARGGYRRVSGNTRLGMALTRRTALDVHYEASLGEIGDAHIRQTLQGAGASISQQLTRDLGLRIGYARRVGHYELADGTQRIENRSIDAGLEYSHALSLSRHTSLSFATGTTAISDGDRTRFRIIGHATLDREIGRTWDAALIYSRDVGFIETLVEPTFSDSLALAIGGLIGRRVELRTEIAATVGKLGFDRAAANRGFDAYDGTTQLTVAVSRYLGISASYTYYRYTFDSDAPLTGAVFRRLDRQSVQAGLTLWAPLLHRARRPHAAR
jgi:hypothetical protein